MRFRTLLVLTAFALMTCASARAQEPQKEQQVIDDFVTTRGVSFDGPSEKKAQPQKQAARPAASPHRNNSTAAAKSPAANSPAASVASGKTSTGKSPASKKPGKRDGAEPGADSETAAQTDNAAADDAGVQTLKASDTTMRPLALGYTILMKDAAGMLGVIDQSREFKTNDGILVALETNADGYLYMFSASNGESPELLYPSALVNGGANALQAHTRETFPTRVDADATNYVFSFTDPPATEHLFIVFSRRPLADVPTGEALVRFCDKKRDCAWTPTAAQWARIKGASNGGRGVTEAKNTQIAQAGAQPVMPNTLSRGIKIKRDDPKPAVVRVNNSPGANVIVTDIVLTHK
jgi:hypothetical protein